MTAKKAAHCNYEVVRAELPRMCGEAGQKAEEIEAYIMKLLESSVLDSAVRALEDRAGGLFMYARLLGEQLRASAREGLIDFGNLPTFPDGLDGMYESNFKRNFDGDSEEKWLTCKKVVAMIAVAKELLPVELVGNVVGILLEGVKSTMSLLFPVHEGVFKVMHKSVIDWLRDKSRAGEQYWIGEEDLIEAHVTLARQLWLYEGWRGDEMFDYQMEGGERYALAYGHVHLTEAIAQGGEDCEKLLSAFSDLFLENRDSSSKPGGLLPVSSKSATREGGSWVMSHAKLGRNQ